MAYSTDYAYIERAYGLHFESGQRIRFEEDGRTGRVLRCNKSHAHYVNVRFDDEKRSAFCHPGSVTILAQSNSPNQAVAPGHNGGSEQDG